MGSSTYILESIAEQTLHLIENSLCDDQAPQRFPGMKIGRGLQPEDLRAITPIRKLPFQYARFPRNDLCNLRQSFIRYHENLRRFQAARGAHQAATQHRVAAWAAQVAATRGAHQGAS